jgi:hypothetical protein
MAYAGWAKGSLALLLACRALARAENVDEPLRREWSEGSPNLEERVVSAARTASDKAWRFVGEMEEIAASMEAAGLPEGFHAGAAELFGMFPEVGPEDDPLECFLAQVTPTVSAARKPPRQS